MLSSKPGDVCGACANPVFTGRWVGQEGFSKRKETLFWTAQLLQARDRGALALQVPSPVLILRFQIVTSLKGSKWPLGLALLSWGHAAPFGAYFFALELRQGDRAQRKRFRVPRAHSLADRMLAAAPGARDTPALSRKAGYSGPPPSAAEARGATCCPHGASAASGLGRAGWVPGPFRGVRGRRVKSLGEIRGADLWGAGGEDEWGCKVKRSVRCRLPRKRGPRRERKARGKACLRHLQTKGGLACSPPPRRVWGGSGGAAPAAP